MINYKTFVCGYMQVNGVNSKEHLYSRSCQQCRGMAPCTPGLKCVGSLHSYNINSERSFSWEHVFKHSPGSLLSLFTLLIHCDGCLSPLLRVDSWLSFQDFLYLGAACQ